MLHLGPKYLPRAVKKDDFPEFENQYLDKKELLNSMGLRFSTPTPALSSNDMFELGKLLQQNYHESPDLLIATFQFELMLFGAFRGRENLDKIKLTDYKITTNNGLRLMKEMPAAMNTFMKTGRTKSSTCRLFFTIYIKIIYRVVHNI